MHKVFNCFKTLLKPTYKTTKSITKRLQKCFKMLSGLAIELDSWDCDYWGNYIRDIATQIASLLPKQFVQLILFDDTEYTDNRITRQPVSECFDDWSDEFNERKFQRDLKRYLADRNFSYYDAPKSPFYQLIIPYLFRMAV